MKKLEMIALKKAENPIPKPATKTGRVLDFLKRCRKDANNAAVGIVAGAVLMFSKTPELPPEKLSCVISPEKEQKSRVVEITGKEASQQIGPDEAASLIEAGLEKDVAVAGPPDPKNAVGTIVFMPDGSIRRCIAVFHPQNGDCIEVLVLGRA